jgi:hypothetical protein
MNHSALWTVTSCSIFWTKQGTRTEEVKVWKDAYFREQWHFLWVGYRHGCCGWGTRRHQTTTCSRYWRWLKTDNRRCLGTTIILVAELWECATHAPSACSSARMQHAACSMQPAGANSGCNSRNWNMNAVRKLLFEMAYRLFQPVKKIEIITKPLNRLNDLESMKFWILMEQEKLWQWWVIVIVTTSTVCHYTS